MREENYFEDQEFLNNLHAYEDARREGKDMFLDADTLGEISEYYRREGQSEKSLEVVDYGLKLFPGASTLLAVKSRHALYMDGDLDQADALAEEMSEKNTSDYVDIKFEILLNREKQEEADRLMRDVYAKVDESDKQRFALNTISTYLDFQLADQAQRWLDLLIDRNDAEARSLEGRIASNQGNYEESEAIFRKLTDDYPYEDDHWMNLAYVQFLANHQRDALESCEFALAINPDNATALVVKGHIFFAMDKYEDALKYYTRFNELEHASEAGDLNIALTLNELGRFKEAIEHFTKAEKKAGRSSEQFGRIYQGMSRALSRTGDVEGAFAYLDRFWPLNDEDDNIYQLERARIMLENQRQEEAVELVMTTLEKAASQPNLAAFLMYRFAAMAYETGLIQLAYETLKMMFTMVKTPKWPVGNAQLAACCHILGKKEEFGPALERAVQLNPAEARDVLRGLFPEELPPEQYYEYYLQRMK
ncbi:MAG: tetratricopeptide repeat protein [Hoylesella enoeca]|uniref:tetratricopeptide repeat protein n=1 Tax=Hoylesella enoeca TaxID=76123 RepID=UPI003FA13D58